MNVNFPVMVSAIEFVNDPLDPLLNPRHSRSHLQVDERDFFFFFHHVASYRVKDGNQIQIFLHKNSDESSVNLFLNGSVLGAVLHQRGIIPFHGSSFVYQGKGIVICGNSGVGKSAVTAAFCQTGSRFINDDITPVQINEEGIKIFPIKTRMKLWNDSLEKLGIENIGFEKIRPSVNSACKKTHNTLFINNLVLINSLNKKEVLFGQ